MFNIEKDLFAFAKRREDAKLPRKKAEDADYDIFPLVEKDIIINPLETYLIPSGISSVICPGYAMIIENRSGVGVKYGLYPQAQTIDEGYRGEWNIVMKNLSMKPVVITHDFEKWSELAQDKITVINAKNAITQAYLRKCEKSEVTQPKEITMEELAKYPSERGESWKGSTNEH